MADPGKHADCEERRGTADDERLSTGNAEKSGALSVNVTFRDISYFIVRNEMSGFVIFCHAQRSRLLTFFLFFGDGP